MTDPNNDSVDSQDVINQLTGQLSARSMELAVSQALVVTLKRELAEVHLLLAAASSTETTGQPHRREAL